MEDGLDVSMRPYDPRRPQVYMDEISTQLLADVREAVPIRPSTVAKEDHAYEPKGTCNIFFSIRTLACLAGGLGYPTADQARLGALGQMWPRRPSSGALRRRMPVSGSRSFIHHLMLDRALAPSPMLTHRRGGIFCRPWVCYTGGKTDLPSPAAARVPACGRGSRAPYPGGTRRQHGRGDEGVRLSRSWIAPKPFGS